MSAGTLMFISVAGTNPINISEFLQLLRRNSDLTPLENLFREYWNQHKSIIEQGYEPLDVAAILMVHALSIYRTVLSAEEYEKMVDNMSARRGDVQSVPQLKKETLH